MRLYLGGFVLATIIGSPASSQQPASNPPVENVTVIGTRDRARVEEFITSFAAPTAVIGKLARWETGICPIVVGLRPSAITFIIGRMRQIAIEVGAPVAENMNCKPNIEIVFTTTPQGLLDNIRKEHSSYIGYADTDRQKDVLAKVIRPIQAWYTTQSRDLMGASKIDSARTIGLGDPGEFEAAMMMGNVSGLHNRDGRKSEMYHVIIAIDPNKLLEHEIGSIADYITFLSLSQLTTLDQCQPLPSIVDMLIPQCQPVGELTPNDLAFLRGLYKMRSDGNLRMQKDEILSEMAKTIVGH